MTAGAAGAAADATTAGAAEAAVARPGHEKRLIDDVTPGDSLGTHVRARVWTVSDDADDSEMSVEEKEGDTPRRRTQRGRRRRVPREPSGLRTMSYCGVLKTSSISRRRTRQATLLCSERWRSRVALRVWACSRKCIR